MTQEASCDTGSAGDSEESLERYQAILDAFVEVAANVEELGDLDNLLRLVARSICDLTGIRRCALYLLGNDGLLHGRVGHGPDANIDRAVQQLVTGWTVDGLTRELIEGKSPILIRDASTDPRTVQEIMQRWQVRSLLAVPLVFSGEVIGAIHLDNIEEEHAYSDLDVDVAQTFASLASSAIAQAAMAARNRERAAVNERQRDHLEQLSRIHANLTEAVLRGDDIPTVLGRLVDLIEKTVVLRDRDFAVMAWSAPDGEHSHDDLEIHAELLSASWEASEQVEHAERPPSAVVEVVRGDEVARRLLAPIRVEGELVGYLDIVEAEQPLDELDSRVAEHAATVVALVILSERRAIALSDQEKDDLLGDLLHETRDASALARRAFLSGVDLSRRHVMMLFAREHGSRTVWLDSAQRDTLIAAASREIGLPCPGSVIVPEGLVALLGPLPDDTIGSVAATRSAAMSILDQLADPLALRLIATSVVCGSVEQYRDGYRELVETLALAYDLGWTDGVVTSPDLGALRLLVSDHQRDRSVRYSSELLQPLLDYDDSKSGELLQTLRAFLACNASNRLTAERLGVHDNTIRYRLARIGELCKMDPNRFDNLVDLRFALSVHDLGRDLD